MESSCLRLLRNLTVVVSSAFVVVAPTAAMADLITLAIPGIKGDVTAKGQEGTIEVLSLSNDVLVPGGGGGRGGKAQFTPMIIHKRIDRASPALFLALAQGKHFPNAVITFLQTTGPSLTKFFTITLTNIVITNFMTDASENRVSAGQEQLNLNFTRIQLKDEITGDQACFDFTTNSKC